MRHIKSLFLFCLLVLLSAHSPLSRNEVHAEKLKSLVVKWCGRLCRQRQMRKERHQETAGLTRTPIQSVQSAGVSSTTEFVTRKENPWDVYEKLGKLGQGTYGISFKVKVRNSKTDRVFALKETLGNDCEYETIKADSLREYSLGAELKHDNIVRTLAFYQWDDKCAILMDYVPGVTVSKLYGLAIEKKDLRSELDANRHALVWDFIYQLSSGVNEICLKKIVHGDLSTHNIMIDMLTNKATIIDFGSASLPPTDNYYRATTESCTIQSPERRFDQVTRGPPFCSADVFALCSIAAYLLGNPLIELADGGCKYNNYDKIYHGDKPPSPHVILSDTEIVDNFQKFFAHQRLSVQEANLLKDMCHWKPDMRLTPVGLVQRLEVFTKKQI